MYKEKRSYRLAFFLAATLHFILLIILIVKFTKSHNYAMSFSSADIIQAEAIIQGPARAKSISIAKSIPAPKQPVPVKKLKPQVQPIVKKALPVSPTSEVIKLRKQKILRAEEMRSIQNELAYEANSDIDNKLAEEKMELTKQAQARAGASNQSRAGGHGSASEIDKYKALVIQAIAGNWIVPEGADKDASCLILINVAPGGMVIDAKLIKSSGNEALDLSAQKAVLKSSPLPVPSDPVLFDDFRTIKLTVRPERTSLSF